MKYFISIIIGFLLVFFYFHYKAINSRDCNLIYKKHAPGYKLNTGAFCKWEECDGCGYWLVFISNDKKNISEIYTNDGYEFLSSTEYGFWYSKHVYGKSKTPPGYDDKTKQYVIYGTDCNYDYLFIK